MISIGDPAHTGMDLGGKTEVQNFDFTPAVDHNIPGFDIAVQHIFIVRIIQGICDLPDDGDHIIQLHGPSLLSYQVPQIFLLAALHDEIIIP